MINKLSLALLFSAFAIAGTKAQVTRDVPTVAEFYDWDSSGQWKFTGKQFFSYDSKGRLEWMYQADPNSDTASRMQYFYDSEGRAAGEELFSYKNGKWTDSGGERYTRIYNAGRGTDQIYERYNVYGNFSGWQNQDHTTYAYDDQGRLDTLIYQQWAGFWRNRYREVYDYSKNEMMNWVWYNDWKPSYRYIDIKWGSSGVMQEYTMQYYDSLGLRWVNARKYWHQEGVNGGYSDSIAEISNQGWIVERKYRVENDTNHNKTFENFQYFNGSRWQFGFRQQFLNTYDADKLTETISQNWTPDDLSAPEGPGTWQNWTRIVYSGHITVTTGIVETSRLNAVKVFPNPATNVLKIRTEQKYTGVVILDLTGKTVQTAGFNFMDKSVDVSGLAPGYYLLRLFGNGIAPVTVRFMKQ